MATNPVLAFQEKNLAVIVTGVLFMASRCVRATFAEREQV